MIRQETSILRKGPQLELKITVDDRVGMLKDISSVISRARINIINLTHIHPSQRGSLPIIKILCDIDNNEKAEKLVLKIKSLKGVREIHYQMV